MVILKELISIEGRQAFRVNQQVLFDFITNHLGQNQLANFGGAEGQDRLIKPPGRNDASREYIGDRGSYASAVATAKRAESRWS